MKVLAPESRKNKKMILPEVGGIEIPEDGIVEVSDNLGNSLIENLGFKKIGDSSEKLEDKIDGGGVVKNPSDVVVNPNIDEDGESVGGEDIKATKETLSVLSVKQLTQTLIDAGKTKEQLKNLKKDQLIDMVLASLV